MNFCLRIYSRALLFKGTTLKKSNLYIHNRYICQSNFSSTASSDNHYDIVISGGGMVGFAMAAALGQSKKLSDLKILLLESAPNKLASNFPNGWQEVPYSNRVCALADSSVNLLDKLGAWEYIYTTRSKNVTNMQVWESESDAHISFGDGKNTVAKIVENDIILQSLILSLPKSVEVRYSCLVEDYILPSNEIDDPTLKLKDGSRITASLLIGSDGANSLVRKSMGVQYLSWLYERHAVVATLNIESGDDEHNTTAWQKFLPGGPIALLPLSKDLSSLVWSTTPSHAKALLSLNDEDFTDALNNALWSDSKNNQPTWLHDVHKSVGKLIRDVGASISSRVHTSMPDPSLGYKQLPGTITGVQEGSRAKFPLGFGHAVHYTSNKSVLIGDAAHRVHPLAGQGVNLGFNDVACLTKVLEKTVNYGRNIGDTRSLQEYESERQKYNVLTLSGVDVLHRLYSTQFPPVVLLRSLGLTAVDSLLPLKEKLMAHAKG